MEKLLSPYPLIKWSSVHIQISESVLKKEKGPRAQVDKMNNNPMILQVSFI